MVISVVGGYFVNRINSRLIHGIRGIKILYILFIPLEYPSQRAKQLSEKRVCVCVKYFHQIFVSLNGTCPFTFALFNVIYCILPCHLSQINFI